MSARVMLTAAQTRHVRGLHVASERAQAELRAAVAAIAYAGADELAGVRYELDVAEPFIEAGDPAPSEPVA